MSNPLWPHGLQHISLPCSSPSPEVGSNLCPLTLWHHPAISFSVACFSSCLQFFSASESFPMSQLFESGDQSIGASASALPMNIQGWFPLGLTGLVSLMPKELSRVFSNITHSTASNLWCSVFFMVQLAHLYMTNGKTRALIIWTFISKVISLLLN